MQLLKLVATLKMSSITYYSGQVQNTEITGSSLFKYRIYRGDLLYNDRGDEWFPVFEEPIEPPPNTTLKM